MVSTRRKKPVISAEFIDDSAESNGNDTYQDEAMSEPEPVDIPSTPRKRGRPCKTPVMPTQASPIHDSPKKPRVTPSKTKKPPATPSKSTPAKAKVATKIKTASTAKVQTTLAANNKSTSPGKAASAKKSKATVSNDDNDGQGQGSLSDEDPRNKARQLIFDTSVSKAKANVENYKKEKATQDVFDEDVTISDDKFTDDTLSKCEVFAPELVDPLLKETYKKLTKLPGQVDQRKYFISWKGDNDKEDENGNGMILYSSIRDDHPNINLKYVKGLVTLTTGQTKGGPLVFIQDRKTPVLCVTLGIIADDQTGAPRQRGDKEVKFITAKLLAYECERMVAVLYMVYGKESVRVQLADSTLTFATRSAEPNPSSSPVKGFATVRSRATMTNNTPDCKFQYSSLGPHDLVPVLDARSKPIKMPSGLGSIERDFPLFSRQVPSGSIALIGYTVGSYSSKANPKDISLSMNVLWVAVLAASEDAFPTLLSLFHDDPVFRMMEAME
ncbi:hypothetical protein K443DRAFT_126366 [Laccaria amethystina LaAM-08-1]|uniref:Uncharacterized protein n=1 Tax=Laccaria amethystina LaAM-08-1 TaxID=1095629 RepID=A0A0C9X343_9AGAR|nr:hypothetical protein K443DRAFT_126366 [Laccaria amethystina LaAM-08-1]